MLKPLARALLAGVFLSGAVDTLREPGSRRDIALRVLAKTLPADSEKLAARYVDVAMKLDAGVKIAACAALVTGRLPRLAPVALLGGLVPVALAGRQFWQEDDPELRHDQKVLFLKDMGLVSALALLLAEPPGKRG